MPLDSGGEITGRGWGLADVELGHGGGGGFYFGGAGELWVLLAVGGG